MKLFPFLLLFLSLHSLHPLSAGEPKHLFILSGQSNMAALKPETTFVPAVEAALGKEKVIVVKDAQSGQPILRWIVDENDEKSAPLYRRLMAKVKPAIKGEELASVTFIWMQGERDAREEWAEAYEERLTTLLKQISEDVGAKELNLVIGRISDFDIGSEKYGHWDRIRAVQEKVAKERPRTALVNTDDLNDKVRKGSTVNDLHMTREGYHEMGRRFAAEALTLLKDKP